MSAAIYTLKTDISGVYAFAECNQIHIPVALNSHFKDIDAVCDNYNGRQLYIQRSPIYIRSPSPVDTTIMRANLLNKPFVNFI